MHSVTTPGTHTNLRRNLEVVHKRFEALVKLLSGCKLKSLVSGSFEFEFQMLKQIMPRDCLPRVIPKSYKCFGVGAKGGMYRTTDQIPKELESIDSIWKSYILSHLLFNQHTTLDNLLDI